MECCWLFNMWKSTDRVSYWHCTHCKMQATYGNPNSESNRRIGVYIFWWPCSDQYKGTWYMQTFLCQLLCGHSKNQFFHYFGLLNDLLHGQYLLNKWFGRKLKLLIMFPSIFGKLISQVWFYCSNFQGNIDMTLELFHLSVIPISCIWVESLFGLFFQQLLLKIQYHIDQELQLALHIQESLRGVLQKFHQLH